jgi:hypothetical protein
MNALAEMGKLLPVMAGEAVDSPDLLRVGELGRIETLMAGNTLQGAVSRQSQLSGIDVQGDGLPLPGHRGPFVRMAGKTIGISSCDGRWGQEEEKTRDQDKGVAFCRHQSVPEYIGTRDHQTSLAVEFPYE